MSKRTSLRRVGLVLGIVAMSALVAGASASWATEPTPFDNGRMHCADFNPSWTELEVDPPSTGEFSDGVLTVDIVLDHEVHAIDWSSNIGVDAVFMKGSETIGNLYNYDPEATSDTGLHNPVHESGPKAGEYYSINLVRFCYDVETSPSPSVSPTGTETSPSPGTTVSPTGVQTSPSVLGTKVVAETGSSVWQLFVAGLTMLLMGVAAFALSFRVRPGDR